MVRCYRLNQSGRKLTTLVMFLSLWLGLTLPTKAQNDLYNHPIQPYFLRVLPNHLVSNALHRDFLLQDQSTFRLYGDWGILTAIESLNSHIEEIDHLAAGTILLVPIPIALDKIVPDYWQRASPIGSGPWRLIHCCDKRTKDLLSAALARSDSWPRVLSQVNGATNGHFSLEDRKSLLIPESLLLQGNLPPLEDSKIAKLSPPPTPVAPRPTPVAPAPTAAPRKPPLTTAQKDIIAAPELHDLAVLTDLPLEAMEEMEEKHPHVLADKLTPESIENLDESVIKKIPKKTIENKAWKFSFLDSFKPGMENLFKGMTTSAAGAYVGARIGFSLIAPEEKLLSQVQVLGLLAEVRQGSLRGLRMYWDYVPNVTARIDGKQQSIAWNRVLVGWSFELPVASQIAMHLTPQLGSYSVKASLPPANTSPEQAVPQEFKQTNAISAGLYVDVEYQAFFYVLRLWASTDRGLPMFNENNEEAVTSRFGFDSFLKGSGFALGATTIAPSYLLFVSLDYLSLRGTSDLEEPFDLQFFIPYLGTGISLSW